MNKLKTMKYKTKADSTNDMGLFDKLSKYSTVRFLRKPGRQGITTSGSSQPASASYDMTGRESDDHKLEIGAPILISKTTIDADAIDPHSDSLTQHGSDQSGVYLDAHSSVGNRSSFGETKISFYSTVAKPVGGDDKMPAMFIDELHIKDLKSSRSKSATNLHKAELNLYLTRTPSTESRIHINSDCIRSVSNHNVNKMSVPCAINYNTYSASQSDANNDFRRSMDSVNVNDSLIDDDPVDDFDLKSASFQSLDARNIFLSIEELNDITKQINESDEFKSTDEIDLEYCSHRDNLPPNERRITLLRNKSHPKILGTKKDKLTNAWTDFKSWIDEERGKIKEVVNKHAAAQRVGANKHADTATSVTTNESSGNIVRNAEFFNRIQLNGADHCNENANCIDTDADHCTNSTGNTLSRCGSRCIVSGGTEDHENQVNSLLTNVSLNARGRSLQDNLVEGQNGFEELRRYVKQGSDFGKDLVAILQERVDSETLYAKSLTKMASKLNKACREVPGTLADAWRNVAAEMESRSEVHRQFSTQMIEEIVKPLKQIADNQHKTRKAIEGSVDKSARILTEWRVSEAKSKKTSHAAARENEKLQDAMLDVRIQRSPSVALVHQSHTITKNNNNNTTNSNNNNHNNGIGKDTGSNILKQTIDKEIKNAEKDCAKLDNKRRKAEESVKRADVEYYTLCIRAERARVEWEMSVLRGSSMLQSHEHQRLESLKSALMTYLKLSNEINPHLNAVVERITPHVNACNVQKDLAVVKNIRRVSEGPSEQLLPDFYCEHTTLAMNRDRRKQALIKLLQLVRTDLERERKSRIGLKGLSQSLNTQENQSISDKLYHIRSMLTYLEGARFKLQSALLELDHKPRGCHPLAPHIQITRDRTGLQQSILKVPLWLKNGEEDKSTAAIDNVATNSDDGSTLHSVDSRNDMLIKKLDRNFNRSKSNVDYGSTRQQPITMSITIGAGTAANTIIVDSNTLDNMEIDRGIADGGSNQQDSDFDEFSSQDEDDDISSSKNSIATNRRSSSTNGNQLMPKIISQCKAIYAYSPKLDDELEINPGDLIDVHIKQEDGWWVGALKNQVGIFPATYVEEIV